jgi:flavin reductase (DIM6/NTAB) family NADH-FMN oxidoreductase RutF
MRLNGRTKEAVMGVDPRIYKETLAHWASGVSVVSALSDSGRAVGITASSLTSLSLDPPQILISVNKRLYTHDAILVAGAFAVSILREEQVEWGMRFAGMIPEIEDRFAGLETFTAHSGAPVLAGALAWLDCDVRHAYDGEDHTIFVGEVMAAGANEGGTPLLYYNRQWRRLDGTPLPTP